MAYLEEIPASAPQAGSSWLDIASGVLQLKQQSDLQKLNVQRIAQGLPPLDSNAMATQVSVGMPPAQLNKILLAAGGAAILLAVVFLMSRSKK